MKSNINHYWKSGERDMTVLNQLTTEELVEVTKEAEEILESIEAEQEQYLGIKSVDEYTDEEARLYKDYRSKIEIIASNIQLYKYILALKPTTETVSE